MPNCTGMAGYVIKVGEAVIILIILVLYRVGNGPHNLKLDVQMLASGVFVGFFIYTAAWHVSYWFETDVRRNALIDIILSFVGFFLWLTIGIIILQNWCGRNLEKSYGIVFYSTGKYGSAIGALCKILAVVYLLETILSGCRFAKEKLQNQSEA